MSGDRARHYSFSFVFQIQLVEHERTNTHHTYTDKRKKYLNYAIYYCLWILSVARHARKYTDV